MNNWSDAASSYKIEVTERAKLAVEDASGFDERPEAGKSLRQSPLLELDESAPSGGPAHTVGLAELVDRWHQLSGQKLTRFNALPDGRRNPHVGVLRWAHVIMVGLSQP